MEIWEVTKTAAVVKKNSAQPTYKLPNAKGVVSEYSKILAEKMSNVKRDVREMEIVREQLDEISEMHTALTGEVKVDEDSGNANREAGSSANIICVEKIRKFLPDGSVMITTYEDGKITDRVKMKPHMISVADYSKPPKVDGSPETILKPTQNFFLEFMM